VEQIVFINGKVTSEFVSKFNDTKLFSYQENKELDVEGFSLPPEQKEKIRLSVISGIVEFYNRFDYLFLQFQNTTGLNFWFLEHHRLNFSLIEKSLNKALIKAFKLQYPHSRIEVPNVKEAPLNRLNRLKRVLAEIVFIIKVSISRPKKLTGNVIFHNEGGTNYSVKELFGDLAKEFNVFKLRSVFDIKKPLPNIRLFDEFINSDQFFLKIITSFSAWKKFYKFDRSLIKLFRSFEQNTFTELDQSIYNHLITKKKYFGVLFFRYLSFDNLFEDNTLRSLIISDENSPQQKVIQYAAVKNNVKVFAIQHGAIYRYHFAYTYGEYTNRPIQPTVTLTWGEYYNNVLLKYGGYNADQVCAVGSLRKKGIDTSSDLRVQSGKKTVLFATQPIPDETLRVQQLKDVFECFSMLSDHFQLIVRPHPNEKEDKYFEEIATLVSFKHLVIERGIEIEEHFRIADVLITAYSTVGAEFVEYFKPIIVLDYLKEDLVGYVKEGVGIPVANKYDLLQTFNSSEIKIDKIAFQKFIKSFFYASDGKAAQRIIAAVESYSLKQDNN